MSKIDHQLAELGIELPEAPEPVAVYVPVKTVGNLVFTSGSECRVNGELLYQGKLGSSLTIEQGYDAARQCMINLLSMLKAHIGDLDRIIQVVKLIGFVNSADGFKNQSQVINGASELLEEVFGEKGRHARSAIATNELPSDSPVEIEIIVEIE